MAKTEKSAAYAADFANLPTKREGIHPRTSKPCFLYLGQYVRGVNIFLTDRSMPHNFTAQQISDLEAVLSPPRFGTYLRAPLFFT